MRLRRLPSSLAAFLVVVGAFACGDSLRQDELDCEEAVSYLNGCCPGFQATSNLQCVHGEGCGNTTFPAISQDLSTCIRSESCQDLVATGVCSRIEAAYAPGNALYGGALCP
jgi:hypothetical protein